MTFPVGSPTAGTQTSAALGDSWADGINYLQNLIEGPLTSFNPTWSSAATGPNIGNGTLLGKYKTFGPMTYVFMSIDAGSTTTFGSGGYRLDLPVPATDRGVLNGLLRHSGVSYRLAGEIDLTSGLMLFRTEPATPTSAWNAMSQGTPVTLSSGSLIRFQGWYT
jgi:hypothetical protein